MEWTQVATQYIKNKEYKYISPVFRFGSIDKQSGKEIGVELVNAALTNTPFLEDLGEIKINKEQQMDREVKELNAKVEVLEVELKNKNEQIEQMRTQACKDRVDGLIKECKLNPTQKEWALSYALKDRAGFEQFVDGIVTLPSNNMFANKQSTEQEQNIDVVALAIKN